MTYYCPHHPEVEQDKPGKCPKCGMKLVKKSDKKSFFDTYKPLIVIISMILLPVLAVIVTQPGGFTLEIFLQYFMAGFFLVFSGFKFLDIEGFAHGYSTYDLLAKRWNYYGYIYPFLELALGLLYLTGTSLMATNWATLLLMTFSGIGVLNEVMQRRQIKCVCLGTIIDVPLTTVTIIEDFGMAAMAFIMLVGI